MVINKWFLILCLSAFSHLLIAQNTIGTTFISEDALEGYTFFSPFSNTNAYMIDNCGQLVNRWTRGTRPGLAAYFLETGLMLRTYKVNEQGPFTSASNSGGLELVDWENNTVWSYEFNTPTSLSHHDAKYMPNGNILVLIWDLVFEDEIITLGRDPEEIAPQGFTWSERIIEIQPIGTDEIEIVWEWRIKEHYIQDFDPAQQNFGVVSEHPELFDVNLPDINSSNSNASRDWNHFNAIDYNEELDLILISTRNSDEIWIIDHSTTTEEASSHSGGKFNQGGDILFRWGNPSAYGRGTVDDQKLFGQHGINWITEGEQAGKILIFNNGNERPGPDYSTIEIIDPPFTLEDGFAMEENLTFSPAAADWIYGEAQSERDFSPFLSNAQFLPNNNILINYGSIGRVIEITQDKEIVWEYIIPLSGNSPGNQGGNINNNGTFRCYKYPIDFAGFDEIEIVLGNPIESNPNIESCLPLLSNVNDVNLDEEIDIHHNASRNQIIINSNYQDQYSVSIFNLLGQPMSKPTALLHSVNVSTNGWNSGTYWIVITDESKFIKSIPVLIF